MLTFQLAVLVLVVVLQQRQKTSWKVASCARWDGATSDAGVRETGLSPVSSMCRPT